MLRTLLLFVFLALGALSPLQAALVPAAAADQLSDLVEEIKKKREDVELSKLDELAKLKTRAAAEAVVELFDSMGSIYMRLELLKRLGTFDGVGEAEQLALQKLMDIATTSEERELSDAALTELGGCKKLGKSFLEMIVESGAEDDVRARAMDLHIEQATEKDYPWYRKVYDKERDSDPAPEPKKKDKKKKKGEPEAEPEVKVYKLQSLREKALSAILSDLSEKELDAALTDRFWGVRYQALTELSRRDAKEALKQAEELYSDLEGRVELRALSAKLLAADEGARIADRFIEDAQKFITPHALRMELADILAEFRDPKVDSKLKKIVGKGKGYEKLFSLRAARYIEDEALDKKLWKLLADKDADVCVAAARIVGSRGNKGAQKPLQKLIDKSKDKVVIGQGIDAMSELMGADAEWDAQLATFATSEDTEIRNAALLQLGKDGRGAHFDLLESALQSPQWSTRLAAMRGLEAMRDKRGVPLLIGRMQQENGRMLVEFADALFNLTGKPYRKATRSWEAWWQSEGERFEVISLADLEKATRDEDIRRMKQITSAKFFGIRIVSHRVIFIIDVSGSMMETMRARYVGGKAETRIEVAKGELSKCIDGLDREALFNIITFSSGVETWLEDGVAGANDTSRDDAKAYVDRLGAGGATNLYDSLRLAFDDPDVDTIFVLSDGEPTAGEQTDIGTIRDHVLAWNEHRGIEINTIGIGGDFQVLEWLAEDSGGTHVKLR